MWFGLIMTFVFGGIFMGIAYVVICNACEFDGDKLNEAEYRHKIKKEPYDCVSSYSNSGYFNNPMDEQGKKEYAEYCEKIEKKAQMIKKFVYTLPAVIYVLLICFFGWLGANVDNNNLRKEIASFESSKRTYEVALKDENLTGLERIEIVGKIAEKNEWLAGKQAEVQIWYNFYLSKDILEIEPIKVTID